MVYITSWDDFVDRSVQLFRADPDSTRYVMKYRHCDGKLVLKVTDNKETCTRPACSAEREDVGMEGRFTADSDLKNGPLIVKCLKFKTDQAQDVKKMEKLNNLFFTLMSRGPDADVSEVTGKEQTEARAGKKGRGRKQ